MSVKIKGLDQLIRELRKFGKDAEQIVVKEIGITAGQIEFKASNRKPFILASTPINKKIENRGLTAKVGVEGKNPFPAYVEFGTGSNFTDLVNSDPSNYDSEVRELAREFYINGLGTLPAQPYLFPSFFEERPKLLENLKRELDNLASKI